MLEYGADAKAKDVDGGTALLEAAEKGHLEIARLLLAYVDVVNSKDKYGNTALLTSSSNEIFRLLIENGISIIEIFA